MPDSSTQLGGFGGPETVLELVLQDMAEEVLRVTLRRDENPSDLKEFHGRRREK